MEKVMGCRELDAQLRHACCVAAAASRPSHRVVHVFGHSHMPVDRTVDGVRYIQRALGYPRDWGGHRGPPTALWER